MSSLLYTVQNLVDEIRSQLDEENRDSVSTESDILPTLNRAQDFAFDIYARRYPEPILQYATLTLIGNQPEYDIPENVFEDRILRIEMEVPSGTGSTFREMQRISYRDIAYYEAAAQTNIPYYYCIFGRKIRLVPRPSGLYSARMWYLRNPEKLVLPQGRVTIINTVSNYVIVDAAGSSLTTESDQLGSYVNIVDGQSGEIKGTLQIQSISSNNKLTFRTVPTRTSVLNRTITGDLSSVVFSVDDYISPIDGTCVPYYSRPTSNFLVQYVVAEISRKLGGPADEQEKIIEKFEKQVERTWVGRETDLRVKKRSQAWGIPLRRRWFFFQ